MTQKANFNRLTRVARAMRARHPQKSNIHMVILCEEMDYAEVDGVRMTLAEYEASRDPNELVIKWPDEGDY